MNIGLSSTLILYVKLVTKRTNIKKAYFRSIVWASLTSVWRKKASATAAAIPIVIDS